MMNDDVNVNVVIAEANENNDIGKRQQIKCGGGDLSWIRDDCLEFYRKELLLLSSDSSSTHTSTSKRPKSPAIQVRERVGLLRLGIGKALKVKKCLPDALFLEFGVHEGKDLVRMATFLRSLEEKKSSTKSHNTNSSSSSSKQSAPVYNTTIHGFDSFEGLPEDWINGQFDAGDRPFHKQGAFDTGGELPDIDNLVGGNGLKLKDHGNGNGNGNGKNTGTPTMRRTSVDSQQSPTESTTTTTTTTKCLDNVAFHKGWFHESLPPFLDDHADTPIAFIHADADLYTSTLTFLRLICERRLLRRGSVIIFDEFWNYPGWEEGEYKAWMEIVGEFGLEFKYEYFGYHGPNPAAKKYKHYGYQSVGVVITSNI